MNPPDTPQPTINLHIDRLVLDGLNLRDLNTTSLQAALSAELTHLLAQGGLSGVHDLPYLRGPVIQPSSRPATLGVQIGQAVYSTVSTSKSSA